MSSNGLPDELTGAFLEVAEVTSLGTAEETESVVGSTTADVSVEMDQDRAEGNKHSQRRTLSKPTYNAVSLEVPVLLTEQGQNLEAFGVQDASGNEDYGNTWEACRIHVYDAPPDEASSSGTVKATYEFEEVEWQLDSLEFSTDFAELTLTGTVHGPYMRGQTTA